MKMISEETIQRRIDEIDLQIQEIERLRVARDVLASLLVGNKNGRAAAPATDNSELLGPTDRVLEILRERGQMSVRELIAEAEKRGVQSKAKNQARNLIMTVSNLKTRGTLSELNGLVRIIESGS